MPSSVSHTFLSSSCRPLLTRDLVLASCFILLVLALRRHRNGDEHMWHGPVTSCAWFNTYNNNNGKPQRGKQSSISALLPTTAAAVTTYTEKPQRRATRESVKRSESTTRRPSMRQTTSPVVPPAPAPAAAPSPPPRQPMRTTVSRNPYMQAYDAPLPSLPRPARGNSVKRSATSVSRRETEAGVMLTPADRQNSTRRR